MSVSPHLPINVEQIGRDHIGGRAELAFLAALHVGWHRRKPNIDVEADLMAGVLGKHRPAARRTLMLGALDHRWMLKRMKENCASNVSSIDNEALVYPRPPNYP